MPRPASYFDRPRTLFTHDQMMERLKERSTRSKAVQSPKEKSEIKLEWESPAEGALGVKTKCGRYSCCKVTNNGKLHYELWKLNVVKNQFERFDQGSGLDNFREVQELCRQDANK